MANQLSKDEIVSRMMASTSFEDWAERENVVRISEQGMLPDYWGDLFQLWCISRINIVVTLRENESK